MHIVERLVRELGERAPQHFVDQIQAAIRQGQSEAELKKLGERLEHAQQLLSKPQTQSSR